MEKDEDEDETDGYGLYAFIPKNKNPCLIMSNNSNRKKPCLRSAPLQSLRSFEVSTWIARFTRSAHKIGSFYMGISSCHRLSPHWPMIRSITSWCDEAVQHPFKPRCHVPTPLDLVPDRMIANQRATTTFSHLVLTKHRWLVTKAYTSLISLGERNHLLA